MCYPRRLKTIRGAVALLGRFGAFLGPAPPGVCKCATLCEEQVEATSGSNGTANATRAGNLTVETETFPALAFVL
tara:strand:- start:194 stop:418 length:225 start_codon:yes stop_codon:yes gene_type:complete